MICMQTMMDCLYHNQDIHPLNMSLTQQRFSKKDFPSGSEGKASAYNAGDPGSIPGSGRSPGEGNGNPLQYSCLENSMDGGAWLATVHGVTKSRTRLSNFTFDEKGYFCMGTERNLTETKSSISRSLIGLSVSASPYGFHINKK